MFVAGQIELPYVMTLGKFIILAQRNSKKKKKKKRRRHITHLDITLYTTKWLTNFNSYKRKKNQFLCSYSQ